uniref:Uncharacterized protein n=1 Tax=Syphacia muris TaxID=451379 RepID=A0A0N5ALB2_9BILA
MEVGDWRRVGEGGEGGMKDGWLEELNERAKQLNVWYFDRVSLERESVGEIDESGDGDDSSKGARCSKPEWWCFIHA